MAVMACGRDVQKQLSCCRLEDNSADRDRSVVDMRAHQLFSDTYYLDCCPSVTQRSGRTYAINKHGLVIELFQTDNETQQFYETICRNDSHQLTIETTSLRRQCKFVDPRLLPYSRCVQQWSYVSALGRPFGRVLEQFSINYVRIRTGCNCQVSSRAIGVILDEHESTTGTLLSP